MAVAISTLLLTKTLIIYSPANRTQTDWLCLVLDETRIEPLPQGDYALATARLS